MSSSDLLSIEQLAPSELERAIRRRLLATAGDVFVRLQLIGDSIDVEFLDGPPAAGYLAGVAGVRHTVAFATWLQGVLRSEHLSQEAAARRVGVSLKTVNRWVNGRTEPRMRELRRIQEVFGASPPL